MRRREALALLAASLAMVAAALTWKFEAWGLLGSGVALTVLALAIDWKKE